MRFHFLNIQELINVSWCKISYKIFFFIHINDIFYYRYNFTQVYLYIFLIETDIHSIFPFFISGRHGTIQIDNNIFFKVYFKDYNILKVYQNFMYTLSLRFIKWKMNLFLFLFIYYGFTKIGISNCKCREIMDYIDIF